MPDGVLRIGLDTGTYCVKCISDRSSVLLPSLYVRRTRENWTEADSEAVEKGTAKVLHTVGVDTVQPIVHGKPDPRYQKQVKMLIQEVFRIRVVAAAIIVTTTTHSMSSASDKPDMFLLRWPLSGLRRGGAEQHHLLVRRHHPHHQPTVVKPLFWNQIMHGIVFRTSGIGFGAQYWKATRWRDVVT
ncbi:MAG: hypothetical protein F4Y18_01270 [Cenarchaeum sp. SB0663_bin_5]|nr:hypothetical protein [Cenarchaeum sp. SB0663_bin_5]MYH04355.1 hypothetical protein [Cenarchaeum sp. SB0675_bin_21]MYL10749.1 hypothetical protein [Cenarchaeum sp. SB0669_bin_11]